jgi:ferredoxin--NADP+ reductase
MLRVAIVGSGPAGCYAAEHLLRQDIPIEVEMFDRLPSPFGLVRAGVAPDHPKTKQVTRAFQWTAGRPGFRLHLNVEIGRHLSHDELLAHHHAVIYAIGSPGDRRLGIPGEELAGSHAATEFVAWYNGHPDYREFVFDLSGKRAVVVGNGNVALDVARILLLSADELAATDIADHALAALAESRIEEVVLLGRRGPAQAAYTSPELLALGNLSDAEVLVDPAEVELDEHSRDYLRSGAAPFSARLKTQILTEFAARKPAGKRRRIVLRFLTSPVEILGDERVEAVRIVRNKLVANPDGSLSARATDETETISAGLVLRSIGYRGRPLAGVPFDDRRATLANDGGRVIDPETGQPLPGVYTAGWIKRGPSGVIGTNKKCAGDTVELLLADYAAGRLGEPAGGDALARLIAERAPDAVDSVGWRAIDAHERRLGETQGRPRVKLARIDEMLHIAQSSGR